MSDHNTMRQARRDLDRIADHTRRLTRQRTAVSLAVLLRAAEARADRAERNVRIAQAVIAVQQDEIAAWRALAAGPGLCSVGVES